MLEPVCDSDEEIFLGPPTDREAFLLAQRFPAEGKGTTGMVTELVGSQSTSSESEHPKKIRREDFDSTMDYIDCVLMCSDDVTAGEGVNKENVPDLVADTKPRPDVSKVRMPVEASCQMMDDPEQISSSGPEISDMCVREVQTIAEIQGESFCPSIHSTIAEGSEAFQAVQKIVLGPYSPITPDVSMSDSRTPKREPAHDSSGSSEGAESVTPQNENYEDAIEDHDLLDVAPPSQVASGPRKPPPNIRFCTEGRQGSKETHKLLKRTPTRALVKSAVKSKVSAKKMLLETVAKSPVGNYIRGKVNEFDRQRTPQIKNVKMRNAPINTASFSPAAKPEGHSAKKKFPVLGEIGSAGKLFINEEKSSVGHAKSTYTKIGHVPVNVDGELKEYSVYEKD